MADGSQTIDRLQVEIKLNTEALNRDLQSVNTKLDSTKTKLGSLETTSCSTAECLKDLGSSTAKAQSEIEKFPDTAKNAENALKALEHTSDFATKTVEETGKAVQETGGAFSKASGAIEEATEFTEDFKKGVEKITKPLDNVKKGIEKFSSALKFAGVAAAAALAFNIIKGEIDKARDAVHQTYTEIDNLETALSKLSTGGKISLEDKIYIDQNASTITNPEQFADIYDLVGDTLTAVSKAMQQSISEAFNLAGLANGINPSQLYTYVYQAMNRAGISPNEDPDKMLKLLDLSVVASQESHVGISDLLKVVKEYLPKLGEANLSVEDLIMAGAGEFKTTQDMDVFTGKLDTLITKSQEAYDAVIENSATVSGYEGSNVEEWLNTLPEDTKQSIIAGAEQASKNNALTMAAGVKDAIKNIDWQEVGTATGGAIAKAQYISSLSQDELLDLYKKEKNTTSAMFGDENGKFGLWQLFEGIDTAYAERVSELMTKKLSGEMDATTFAKQSKALDTQKEEAVLKVWLDLGTGKLVGGTTKSGAEYLQEQINLAEMDLSEAIMYNAGNLIGDVGSDMLERANYNLENIDNGNPSYITKDFASAGSLVSAVGEGLTSLALNKEFNPENIPDFQSVADGVENLGTQMEDTMPGVVDGLNKFGEQTTVTGPLVQEFTTNTTDPLGESTGVIETNIQDILNHNQTYLASLPSLQTSLSNETTSVNTLAEAYERLAAAKQAAGAA